MGKAKGAHWDGAEEGLQVRVRSDTDLLDKATPKGPLLDTAWQRACPVSAPSLQELVRSPFQPRPICGARRHCCQGTLEADEFRPLGVPVLLQPVPVDQSV